MSEKMRGLLKFLLTGLVGMVSASSNLLQTAVVAVRLVFFFFGQCNSMVELGRLQKMFAFRCHAWSRFPQSPLAPARVVACLCLLAGCRFAAVCLLEAKRTNGIPTMRIPFIQSACGHHLGGDVFHRTRVGMVLFVQFEKSSWANSAPNVGRAWYRKRERETERDRERKTAIRNKETKKQRTKKQRTK